MTNPSRPRRRPLDFSELRESSLIADLVHACDEDDGPGAHDVLLAPVLDLWSVAEGPVLIGCDETGVIRALEVYTISRVYLWAQTSEGLVRLGDKARIPLARAVRP